MLWTKHDAIALLDGHRYRSMLSERAAANARNGEKNATDYSASVAVEQAKHVLCVDHRGAHSRDLESKTGATVPSGKRTMTVKQ